MKVGTNIVFSLDKWVGFVQVILIGKIQVKENKQTQLTIISRVGIAVRNAKLDRVKLSVYLVLSCQWSTLDYWV